LIIITTWLVQFSQVNIIGADGFLHARMADMISRQGFLKNLPQAHFSWFLNRFSDKDFIYHLYLIPFIKLAGFVYGTKIAAYLSTLGLFLTVVFYLYRNASPKIYIPAAVVLISSSQFLRDTAEARPFIWAMLLTLLGINYVIRQNRKAVFIISLIYGMTHLSAWVLPAYAIIYSIYLWARGEKSSGIIAVPAFSGYLISFILHPNFPNNLFISFLNGILVPWYAITGGVLELGAEFFPINTQDILYRFPYIFISVGVILSGSVFFRGNIRRVTKGWGIAVLLFGVFAVISVRNMTHLYPVLIIFTGLLLTDISLVFREKSKLLKDRVLSVVIPMGIIFMIFAAFKTVNLLNQMFYAEAVYASHFSRMAEVFKKNIPPGARIFHSNWSDTQYFIGMAPEYEYYVTFDPVYMYSYNRNLYALYRQLSFGQTQDPYSVLKNNFQTRYGYAGKNYFGALINQIRQDKRFTIISEDELGIVFTLADKSAEK
jgi:hypothetical protein